MKHTKQLLWLALVLVSALGTVWAMSGSEIGYQTISPAVAWEQLQNDSSILLVDVRTPEEFQDSHIPGALLLPLQLLPEQAETVLTDKDQVLYVYCRSGNRSAHAANMLVSLGYTRVYDLGGIIDWPYLTTSGS